MPFNDDQSRVVVDWGTQGASVERRPLDVDEEMRQIKRWWKSPEVVKKLKEMQAEAVKEETKQANEQVEVWKHDFETVGQSIAVPASAHVTIRRVPLPEWLASTPADYRPLIQVGMFDASDASQVRWAIAQRTSKPQMQLFAVGWKSMQQFFDLHKAHPTLNATTIRTIENGPTAERWVSFYGVTKLPAFVTVDGLELILEEGGAL
jgi:hypothetical protein